MCQRFTDLSFIHQLKAVGPVAVIGGLLQIVLFMFLCGLTAAVLIFIYCPLIFFVVFASSYSLFYRKLLIHLIAIFPVVWC